MVGALRATVARRRLTADEFERMVETGIIREDERVELVDGELIQMAAQGGPHVTCAMRLNAWFTPRLVERAIVSIQNAFRLSLYGEPQPDVVLLRYREDFYGGVLPRAEDVFLIIEISDTTFHFDRDVKVPRYAAEGIPETWIVDLQRKRVIVYRDPTLEGYRQEISHTRGAVLSPLAFPDLELRWEDIFGKT